MSFAERYGNLFEMYERITGENPYQTPMRIYPAVHYTMGGTWVDYNLMSTLPGLHVIGEANFSDHGANRLGASALMQGLADGYFVLPYTIGDYLASTTFAEVDTTHPAFQAAEQAASERIGRLLSINGTRSVDSFHKELGKLMWDYCGMARNARGTHVCAAADSRAAGGVLEQRPGPGSRCGHSTSRSRRPARVADFMEFAELMCRDALEREESCGGHFRTEYQTADGEAVRNDQEFAHVAVWEYRGEGVPAARHEEQLDFEFIELATRSYK